MKIPICDLTNRRPSSFFIHLFIVAFEQPTSLAACVVVSTVGLLLHFARSSIFRFVMVFWLILITFSFRGLGIFCVENIPQGTLGAFPSKHFSMYVISSLLGTEYCLAFFSPIVHPICPFCRSHAALRLLICKMHLTCSSERIMG